MLLPRSKARSKNLRRLVRFSLGTWFRIPTEVVGQLCLAHINVQRAVKHDVEICLRAEQALNNNQADAHEGE